MIFPSHKTLCSPIYVLPGYFNQFLQLKKSSLFATKDP